MIDVNTQGPCVDATDQSRPQSLHVQYLEASRCGARADAWRGRNESVVGTNVERTVPHNLFNAPPLPAQRASLSSERMCGVQLLHSHRRCTKHTTKQLLFFSYFDNSIHLPWCASDPTDALGDGRSNVSSHRERCRPRRHNICDIDTTCARPSIVTVDPTVWTDNRDPEIYQTVYTQHEYATVRSDQNSNSSKLVRSVSV